MDYQRIHDAIIHRAKTRTLTGYKERHHIIPRCMGGGNEKINLADLTAREHFIIHKLLCEIYPDNKKLGFGLWMLTKANGPGQQRNYKISSREYERIKLIYSNSLTGRIPWNKGLKKDDPRVAKYATVTKWNKGLKKDDPRIQQQIKKSVQSRTGKKRGKYNVKYETCLYCNQLNTLSVIRREHMDKCKYKL